MNKFLVIFLLINFSINSQNNWKNNEASFRKTLKLVDFDSSKHKRIYEIDRGQTQFIQLIENSNTTFSGTITSYVTYEGKCIKNIYQLNSKTVEKLISTNKIEEIKKIKSCKLLNNCIDGFDGDVTIFKFLSKKKNNTLSFWNLEESYQKTTKERKKANKILKFLNKKLSINKLMRNFLCSLPKKEKSYLVGNYKLVSMECWK